MTIADTSGLLALFNRREPSHSAVAQFVDGLDRPLVVSPYVLAELDYLVASRMGLDAELAVLQELAGGAYDLVSMDSDDVQKCTELINTYNDLQIGLTDASLVVLAERYDTTSILTLDHRHFSVIRPLSGGLFTLAPND